MQRNFRSWAQSTERRPKIHHLLGLLLLHESHSSRPQWVWWVGFWMKPVKTSNSDQHRKGHRKKSERTVSRCLSAWLTSTTSFLQLFTHQCAMLYIKLLIGYCVTIYDCQKLLSENITYNVVTHTGQCIPFKPVDSRSYSCIQLFSV